jgi:hypothetical protein
MMSRPKESGHNYITEQVRIEMQKSGKEPCEILDEWLSGAKQKKILNWLRQLNKL